MKKSTPKYRGQRISHAELVAESRETLRDAGVGNHERAMFISELSKAVVGNKSPLLYQIQPRVRFRTSKAWKKAYDIIFSYIAENNLEKTLETVGIEMGENLQQASRRLASEPNANFDYLLNVDRTVDTFNQKVKKYTAMTSDSESFAERRSPNQQNKAVQNTPDRQARQTTIRQTPIEREEEIRTKETQTRRIKKVKRVKKTSDYDITIDTKSEQINTSNRNYIITPESEFSPSKQQGFANSERVQKRKQEGRKKPNITGAEYVINSLRRSHPSDYEVNTQSEFEISDKDMLNDLSYSNE